MKAKRLLKKDLARYLSFLTAVFETLEASLVLLCRRGYVIITPITRKQIRKGHRIYVCCGWKRVVVEQCFLKTC
jgi:hypothetical protein